jgi:hypothetical protein
MYRLYVECSKKKGVALTYVVVIFAVIVILSMAIVGMTYTNLVQAKAQEIEMRAYYLSVSGYDLCLSALLQQGSGGQNDTLLYQYFNPTILTPATMTDTLSLPDGVVHLTVSAYAKDGERWISIQSTGTLNSTGTTKTTKLDFMYANPAVQSKS